MGVHQLDAPGYVIWVAGLEHLPDRLLAFVHYLFDLLYLMSLKLYSDILESLNEVGLQVELYSVILLYPISCSHHLLIRPAKYYVRNSVVQL